MPGAVGVADAESLLVAEGLAALLRERDRPGCVADLGAQRARDDLDVAPAAGATRKAGAPSDAARSSAGDQGAVHGRRVSCNGGAPRRAVEALGRMPEAVRTIVKSPPELWAEVSDPTALTRHLGAFGEIRITRLEPEATVAWEGDRASGTVDLWSPRAGGRR